ncbi:hypothetical protein CK247_30665, partial [Klebsiella pneumoniae]
PKNSAGCRSIVASACWLNPYFPPFTLVDNEDELRFSIPRLPLAPKNSAGCRSIVASACWLNPYFPPFTLVDNEDEL